MANLSSLLVSTAVVAVPAVSVGAYYLSSNGKSTSEEPVTQQDKPVESATQSSPSIVEKKETVDESKPWIKQAKEKLSQLSSTFPYLEVSVEKGNREKQFENFVSATDDVREETSPIIKKLLNKEESRSWSEIFEKDLGFTLIKESDSSELGKLIQIRQGEVEAQPDADFSTDRRQLSAKGDDFSKDSIMKFCKDPSVENSHLGLYSPTREIKETVSEYRFFTYYSYCTKESFYLSDQLVFEKTDQQVFS